MNPSNVSQLIRNHNREGECSTGGTHINSSRRDGDTISLGYNTEKYYCIAGATSNSTPANINKFPGIRMPEPQVSDIKIPNYRSGSPNSSLNVYPSSNQQGAGCSLTKLAEPAVASLPQPIQQSARSVSFASCIPIVVTAPPSPHLMRPRSGSWSGVNESDEELEQLNENSSLAGGGSYATYGSTQDHDRSSPSTQQCHHNREIRTQKMRRKLKFFFMNPVEKWRARNRFPWKLLLQIIKIFVVTSQLWMFAEQRYSHVAYLWDTRVSFAHMFLRGWDSSREVNAYPPSDGPLAVYTKEEFFSYLDYSLVAYTNLSEMSIGSYQYYNVSNTSLVLPSRVCCEHYTAGYSSRRNECIHIPWGAVNSTGTWSTKQYLTNHNFTIMFDKLLSCDYQFKVKAVKLRTPPDTTVPDCYNLTTAIVFDNDDRDGQMLVGMNIQATVLSCTDEISSWSSPASTTINCITILLCGLSLGMCLRSLYRAQVLRYLCAHFFHVNYSKRLSIWDQLEFCNFWYVLICVNDVLIIVGTLLKLGLESRMIGDSTAQVLRVNHAEFVKGTQPNYEGYLDTWNVCSLFLGIGNLLVWFGCLRYLGFFQTYNVLILTLKKCLPNVLRYGICILMLFAGYCFCGWLVLSPYHIKFRSLSTTMECLYSLINGDDMFATFSSTSGKDPVIWWFSRIYLYTFISLFIYVILSLFLAIIMDAYDTIKNYYSDGFPLSPLKQFVQECQEDATSRVFHEEGDQTIHDLVNKICCCCIPSAFSVREPLEADEGLEPLL